MKLTDGENPPKSNESNNCCDPIPVPVNGSKYLTIAGGTLCNTLFTSIELVFDNVIPNDLDTAFRILYDCTPSTISIDAENHFKFPPESASVPYAFDNFVIYDNELPTNVSEKLESDKNWDPVLIPNVFNKLFAMLTWLTWFEYSITADSNAV